MPQALTTNQRLATLILGEDLGAWVAERRDPDARLSWRLIARQLAKATDGQVDVTGEALRGWYGHLDAELAAAEAAS